jgi:hypothetical protein
LLVAGVPVEPPEGAGSPGATEGAPVGAGAPTAVGGLAGCGAGTGAASTQVHAAGQSASTVQVVVFGAHAPIVLVVVVHVSPGATGALRLAYPVGAVPPATGVAMPTPVLPPPEQVVVMANVHEKPSPQSASAWQGSCHLYAHVETLLVVQVGGLSGAKHAAFGGHVEPPPVHVWRIWV